MTDMWQMAFANVPTEEGVIHPYVHHIFNLSSEVMLEEMAKACLQTTYFYSHRTSRTWFSHCIEQN